LCFFFIAGGARPARPPVAVLLECYKRLGFTELASNVERVYAANYANSPRGMQSPGHHWWVFWRDTGS